jgi:predicted transposase YdaD
VGRDWDGTWKRLFEQFPVEALGQVCGIPVRTARIVELPTERQRPVLPDRVFKVVQSDGSQVVVHVEIQVRPESGFELRLATYFTLLATRHGAAPHQVVILPVGGPYAGRFRYGRLALDYDVVDVTRLDPEPLLAGPLAPLALWSAGQPEQLIDRVVERIAALGDLEHQTVLVELAILKSDRVAILIRDALERKNMSNVLEGTQLGQELLQRGEARGEARGRAEALHIMLIERFGDVPGLEAIAASLATGGDFATSLKRIRAAASPQDLAG